MNQVNKHRLWEIIFLFACSFFIILLLNAPAGISYGDVITVFAVLGVPLIIAVYLVFWKNSIKSFLRGAGIYLISWFFSAEVFLYLNDFKLILKDYLLSPFYPPLIEILEFTFGYCLVFGAIKWLVKFIRNMPKSKKSNSEATPYVKAVSVIMILYLSLSMIIAIAYTFMSSEGQGNAPWIYLLIDTILRIIGLYAAFALRKMKMWAGIYLLVVNILIIISAFVIVGFIGLLWVALPLANIGLLIGCIVSIARRKS
jgi:hypothetical protein